MRGVNLFLSLLAVLSAGISVALFSLIGGNTRALKRENENLHAMLERAREDRSEALAERDEARARAEAIEAEIREYKARNVTLEARNRQLSREVLAAREQIEALQRVDAARDRELAELRQQLIDATALAGTTPAQDELSEKLAAYEARIADLEAELEALRADKQTDALAGVPPDLTGSVLEVGPKSAFVVLDIGAQDGAVPTLEMNLRRGSRVIARIRITDVYETTSVAHVLPDTVRSRIRAGDTATRS
ncbi:MAG: hypothetical protein D6781_00520 [Verrucomicrobia bacterium]|nr:MAG: hypothetical protein D6781_00520 [Verrucomicrobiota bacterium]